MECQCQKCHSPWVLFAQRRGPITIAAHYRLTFSANGLVALPASVDRLVLLTMHANGAGHSSVQISRGGLQAEEHLCEEVGETICR